MNVVLKSAAGVLLLMTAASRATGQPLTLGRAVDEALSRNPAIAGADARRQAASARENEARGTRWPRVDLAESATRSNNPVFVFGSLLEQGALAPRHFDPGFLNAPPVLTNYRAAVTVRYAIFDQLRAATAEEQARNGMQRAARNLDDVRQQVRSEAIARFYGVLIAREKLGAAREAVRSAEADAKKARDRFEQGLTVQSDALSADVQLATLKQRVIAGEGELGIAEAALATLLQRPRHDAVDIAGAIPDRFGDLPDLDQAVTRAIARRADATIASIDTSDARLRLVAERRASLPRVDAFGTLGASGGTFARRNADHTEGIAVTLEVFDRSRPARVAAARAEVEVARAGEAAARDVITMEVVAAWYRFRAARENAGVAAGAAEQAEAAARIIRDRYEQGLTTITEQLRAQTALIAARFDLLAARYEIVIAHAGLLRATGELDDVQPFL